MSVNTPFHCSKCNKNYKTKRSLYNHNKRFHSGVNDDNLSLFDQSDLIFPQFTQNHTNNDFIPETISSQLNINSDFVEDHIDLGSIYGDNECIYCYKVLSRPDSLKRHYQTCKKKKEKKEKRSRKYKDDKDLKKKIEELQKKIEKLENEKNDKGTNIQNIQTQLNNNGTINNNQININITALGLEEVAAILTDAQQQDVIKRKANSILALTKLINLNNDFPQFNNIVITNHRNNKGFLYDKEYKKFILVDKTELLNNVLECRADDMYELIEYQKDNMPKEIIETTNKFVDELLENEKIRKRYINKLNDLIYNHSNNKLLTSKTS